MTKETNNADEENEISYSLALGELQEILNDLGSWRESNPRPPACKAGALAN